MQEYINGCYTKYGSRPLEKNEISFKTKLPNGLWMVAGFINTEEDGISVDVYKDENLTECLFWQHGIKMYTPSKKTFDPQLLILMTMERCKEMRL